MAIQPDPKKKNPSVTPSTPKPPGASPSGPAKTPGTTGPKSVPPKPKR